MEANTGLQLVLGPRKVAVKYMTKDVIRTSTHWQENGHDPQEGNGKINGIW